MLRTDVSESEVKEDDVVADTVHFRSAAEVAKNEQRRERLSTGSKNLDALLSGGVEQGCVTQFYGESNVEKTHLCHLLCVVLPLHFQSIYIDTEGGFSGMKIRSIATARNTKEQESYLEAAGLFIDSNPAFKLLIVDSMTSLYRMEYPGRSTLTKRQAAITKYVYLLSNITKNNDVAGVVTNQVQCNPNPLCIADKINSNRR
ncbi:MAG TPA: hypothetical protein VH500_18430 [Nitrososphaeraceae archaeon]|jgi:DNA repair protein RadA